MLISSADIPDPFGGKWPFQFDTLKLTITPAPFEDRELVENSAWMPKDALGRDPVFKVPYLSPLPQEVAIPFYRCVNRGLLETRESPNIPGILWTLVNRGAGLFIQLCHGSAPTVMAALTLICSLERFAKSHERKGK